jgi:hypothetical protein
VDALNLHIYPGLTAPEAYEEPLRQLREKMQTPRMPRPRSIWFTEGVYYADDDTPFEPYHEWLKPLTFEAEAAEWQVKLDTLLLTYGVQRIIYHSGTIGSLNHEDLAGIFFEWAATPRKMLVAQATLASLLVPPVRPLGRREAPTGLAAYGFESQGRTILVVWATDETKPVSVSIAGEGWKTLDLQGNLLNARSVTLTPRPLYFVTEGTGSPQLPWP